MKKNKLIIVLTFVLLILYSYVDNKSYYYGFGKGYLSLKLPHYIKPHYRGTDLGNTGFAFVEKDINLDVIDNLHPVYLSNNQKIIIKKFLGYGFDEDTVTVKICDSFNNTRYIKIYESDRSFVFKETNFILKGLKYINLDKSNDYFNRIKIFKNLVFILLCVSFINLLLLVIKRR